MKMGSWLRENLRKMRCFFRWGHWIVRYIVEEGKRERAGGGGGGGGEKKGTLVSLFYFIVCVFWFVEEGESTPTYITYLDPGITYERGALFRRGPFCFGHHYLLGVFWELAIYLFQTYSGRKKAVSFSRASAHHVRARGV